MSEVTRAVRRLSRMARAWIADEPVTAAYHADSFRAQQLLLRRRPPQTIFDVGANKGQTALAYSRIFPTARMHCFEPFPDSLAIFRDRCGHLPQIETHGLALADRAGKRRFFANACPTMNSLLPLADAAPQYIDRDKTGTRDVVEVETTTIDAFCDERKLDRIDVLKLDIQGGELMALHGAREMLSGRNVGLIYTEILFGRLYEGQGDFHEICAWLADFDFHVFGLYNFHYGPNHHLSWGDAIFVGPALQDQFAPATGHSHRPHVV
jgi:FkbM family methyltransferase